MRLVDHRSGLAEGLEFSFTTYTTEGDGAAVMVGCAKPAGSTYRWTMVQVEYSYTLTGQPDGPSECSRIYAEDGVWYV